jgi:general L-amino acid transport system permease protein
VAAFFRRCFAGPLNIVVTLAIVAGLGVIVPDFLRWAVFDAVWSGGSPKACAGIDAACWLFIREHLGQLVYGGYPAAERWRVAVATGFAVVALGALVLPWRRHKVLGAAVVTLGFPIFAGVLLRGGVLGLTPVPTSAWGGLFLTGVVAAWTIATTLPAGLALALARRSSLPVIAGAAAFYVDVMRGLPIVGVLFLAIVLLPLFVPEGVDFNVLLRAMIAFSLFNAANMAEVMRGAIQAVPKGQEEAARSLGLGHWQTVARCILPQALLAALPGIVNVSIAIIKETTILLIAGLFDVLGVLQGALIDPDWNIGDQVRQTAYFFAGAIFFLVCFTLSRMSARLERRLDIGRRR